MIIHYSNNGCDVHETVSIFFYCPITPFKNPPFFVPFPPCAACFSPTASGEASQDEHAGARPLGAEPSVTTDPRLKLFHCVVCGCFTSDSLEALGAHASAERGLPEAEWHVSVGELHQCTLCGYGTQLRANFQLHCKTERHVQRHGLAAHMREGGEPGCWRTKALDAAAPVHLRCNACNHQAGSVEKMRQHAVGAQHEAGVRLYKVGRALGWLPGGGGLVSGTFCTEKPLCSHGLRRLHVHREALLCLE